MARRASRSSCNGGSTMKFERVKLSNFKCYDDADLRLDNGVTVIHGSTGAGSPPCLRPVSSRCTARKRWTKTSVTWSPSGPTTVLSNCGFPTPAATTTSRAGSARPERSRQRRNAFWRRPKELRRRARCAPTRYGTPADGQRGVRQLRLRPSGRGEQTHQRLPRRPAGYARRPPATRETGGVPRAGQRCPRRRRPRAR